MSTQNRALKIKIEKFSLQRKFIKGGVDNDIDDNKKLNIMLRFDFRGESSRD